MPLELVMQVRLENSVIRKFTIDNPVGYVIITVEANGEYRQ